MPLDEKPELESALYYQIANSAADAIIAADKDGRILFFNASAEHMFGRPKAEMLGNRLETLLPHRYRSGHAALVKAFLAEGKSARHMGDRHREIIGMRADGAELHLGATILVVDLEGDPVVVAILRDISERVMLVEQLSRIANVDPLTGALNRRAFLSAAENEWRRAARFNTRIALLLLDIDFFKTVNDRFGHDVGDAVLCRFVEFAEASLRDDDVFARWGGEEFIATLPHADMDEAVRAAERIRETLGNHVFTSDSGEEFHVTVSIGVADKAGPDADLGSAIKLADKALYQAKAAGRNRVVSTNELWPEREQAELMI